MKNIKNIILGLVCSVGLFAATTTTTVKATEPKPAYCLSCFVICGSIECFSSSGCMPMSRYEQWEAIFDALPC